MKASVGLGPRVTVGRIRALFGDAGPVKGEIWEEQFDHCDDELRQLARTTWDRLGDQSFWVYFHDLTYVKLQPELFRYLFPACLVIAQERLMEGKSGVCAGDSDFLKALSGDNWGTVCSAGQVEGVYEILTDGFLDRLDQQRGFNEPETEFEVDDPSSKYNWIGRFHSLGYILPSIQSLWDRWWKFDTPGKAVAALEYAWCFASNEDEHDEIDRAIPSLVGPDAEPDAGIYGRGWKPESVDFLRSRLTFEYLLEGAERAAAKLWNLPEERTANLVVQQARRRRDLVEERLPNYIKDVQEGWDRSG